MINPSDSTTRERDPDIQAVMGVMLDYADNDQHDAWMRLLDRLALSRTAIFAATGDSKALETNLQMAAGDQRVRVAAPFCWAPGQALTVVQTDEPGHWSLDWKPDQVIYFAGWSWEVRKGRADVWVSDVWPPRHNGDLTDGWDPVDLTLAAAQASTGGEGA